ncbi:MAG: DUF6364 family protein [Chitinophagaceae bacterium]
MTVKLNLTIDEKVAQRSKLYAAKKGTSISKMVQEYLNKITQEKGKRRKTFAEQYAASLKKPVTDISEVRDKYLKNKYGR